MRNHAVSWRSAAAPPATRRSASAASRPRRTPRAGRGSAPLPAARAGSAASGPWPTALLVHAFLELARHGADADLVALVDVGGDLQHVARLELRFLLDVA